MKKSVWLDVALAGLCLGGFLPAWAQQQRLELGTLQRSIESLQLPLKPPEKAGTSEVEDASGLLPLDKLLRVDVRGEDALASTFKAYWNAFVGQSVSVDELAKFKAWADEEARENGLYALTQTHTESHEAGDVLVVTLVAPRIKSIQVVVLDEDLARRYEALLTSRFSKDLVLGRFVDLNELDQRLESVAYDLPVNLEIAMRSAGANLVDLVINVSASTPETGKVSSGVLQVNNYGLKQYGRSQVVGMLTVAGYTPHAQLNVSTQASEGVRFGRAEYEGPVEAYAGRMKIYGSHSDSKTLGGGETASRGTSQEVGVGLTHMWGTHQSFLFKTVTEIGARQTIARLAQSDLETSRVEESQLRWMWSMDNERVAREPSKLSVMLTAGEYTRLGVYDAFIGKGGYKKLNVSGRLQRHLSRDGAWQWVGRMQAQVVSRKLDAYNRIALGGVNGVRAYTAADGVGDQGMGLSVELNRRFSSSQWAGVFYDAGLVRPNKHAVQDAFNCTYSLQAVGAQWSGNVDRAYYSLTLAKGFGGYKLAEQPNQVTESQPDPWRLAVAMSYVF